MSFVLPDLVVESVIRDGIANIVADPTILDDVFEQLNANYASRKYGTAEITKIKDLLTGANKDNIAFVHSFHAAHAKAPAYSIQLGSDVEDKPTAYLDDFDDDLRETITDPVALSAYEKETGILPDSYNTITGMVSVPDSVDLSTTYTGYIYVDGSDNEHTILSGISDTTGSKFFFIAKGATVDIGSAGLIKSPIDYTQTEIRGSHHEVQLLIGVHTKEALLTKYLYTLLKYFLKSRKHDLVSRGIIASTMSGSDFTRDLKYEGDMVYTRFLTFSGKINDSWRSDQVQLIDSVAVEGTPIDC